MCKVCLGCRVRGGRKELQGSTIISETLIQAEKKPKKEEEKRVEDEEEERAEGAVLGRERGVGGNEDGAKLFERAESEEAERREWQECQVGWQGGLEAQIAVGGRERKG